jgi:prepilin-type N-terminal cleavage/methylation domain-containing protein
MSHRAKGFTLLELMLVVTIISIIATIAIPNMLRARMAANEAAAIQGLKAIAEGQEAFRRQSKDWAYGTGGALPALAQHTPGVQAYASRFYFLYKLTLADSPKEYINVGLAQAHYFVDQGPLAMTPAPHTGYYYCDIVNTWADNPGNTKWVDPKILYAVYATPAEYNISGLNSFYLDSRGTVYQCDRGLSEFPVAMPEKYQDLKGMGWFSPSD